MEEKANDKQCSVELEIVVRSSDTTFYFSRIDLKIIIIYTILMAILAVIQVSLIGDYLLVIGAAMLFFIPGYSILSMLFPVINASSLKERIAFSVGFSVALSFLAALVLSTYYSYAGLDSIIFSLSLITIPCALISYLRRPKIDMSDSEAINFEKKLIHDIKAFFLMINGRNERFITGCMTIFLICLIFTTAYIIIVPHQGETFTEFYILGPEGKATDYPLFFDTDEEKVIIIGIANHEYRSVNYDLKVILNNSNNFSQIYEDQISLGHNQTIEKSVLLKPDQRGDNIRLEFQLYIDGNISTPYRELYTWISAK